MINNLIKLDPAGKRPIVAVWNALCKYAYTLTGTVQEEFDRCPSRGRLAVALPEVGRNA
jgi:hypothetical protein